MCLHRGYSVREATARRHLPRPNALGQRAHTPVGRRRCGPTRTLTPPTQCAGARREAARCQMGEGDTGGDDTYLAAPPSPSGAAAELATPRTIFRRRLLAGGSYQPLIRHHQPTQPPASWCLPRPRTPHGREGSGRRRDAVRPLGSGSGTGGEKAAARQSRGAGTTGEPRGSTEGSAGQRTRPRLGLLLSTPSLPPRSMPGICGRGRGAPRSPGGAERRSAGPEVDGLPERRTFSLQSLSAGLPLGCPPLTRGDCFGAACFGASRCPGAYYRKVSLTFLATASWPEVGRPCGILN